MDKLQELKQKKSETVARMRAVLDTADKEKRDISEAESKEYDSFEASLDGLDKSIEREERLAKEEDELRKVTKKAPSPSGTFQEDKKDFRNLGEFVYTLVANPRDERLLELRVQQMKDGTLGGYAIPSQYLSTILSVSPQEAIIRPRATVIPAGSPPDAELTIPALDQTAARNMWGGITINHDGESNQITETTMRLKRVVLKPKKLTGYMTISNECLANWDAASALIQNQLRSALIGAEDYDFLRGDGVNKALGVLNSPARVDYTRATASQIAFADVAGMFARVKFGGSLAWVSSQTCIPQLVTIADASSSNLWVQSAGEGLPPTLMGIPVLFNDRSPALGSAGDLALVDLKYYLIKDGSGPTLALSEHFRFQNDEVALRITRNVDGQSWLSEPIALEGSTANTVSPFVVLN